MKENKRINEFPHRISAHAILGSQGQMRGDTHPGSALSVQLRKGQYQGMRTQWL
jgi:hypothetical protein